MALEAPTYPEAALTGVLHGLHGDAVGLLKAALAVLVVQGHLLHLLGQVLPLVAKLGLQLLQGTLRLGQLQLQTLFQQGDLRDSRERRGGGHRDGEWRNER